MNVHFIAIGGSAMHNLALALKLKGYNVGGSDDEIFDPARTRLKKAGILPEKEGWFPEKITPDLDAVVLGMHARKDNPELLKAQELGLKIYSYPEYLYEQSKDKVRIVVGGSHGKTTITSMILHVMRATGVSADFIVGAQLAGFNLMVHLSDREAKNGPDYMVIEGDEYLTSPIDPRPKFHLYHPNIAVVSGIAWDHMNVFPTFDVYKEQFTKFVNLIEPGGKVIYCEEDPVVKEVVEGTNRKDIEYIPYGTPHYKVAPDGEGTIVTDDKGNEYPMHIFGRHNMQNLMAASHVCECVSISPCYFLEAMKDFEGAAQRLELVMHSSSEKELDKKPKVVDANSIEKMQHTRYEGRRTYDCSVYRDFAHAPSKLRATVAAMKEEYPNHRLVACMELHTYSSLSDNFLQQYAGTMDKVDVPIVYFNPSAVELKHLPPLSKAHIHDAFQTSAIEVYDDSAELQRRIKEIFPEGTRCQNLLMMSSGNFDGIDFKQLAEELL